MVPMQACQLLLGRPWLYDRDVQIFGRTNKLSFVYKRERISLLPLTPEEILKDDLKKKQRESENHFKVTHKNSEEEFPQPDKTPQLQRTQKLGKQGLVMTAKKGDLKQLSEPNATFFVILYKKIFFPLTTYPLLCQVLFLMSYRILRMCFHMRCHQGCHPREGSSIKLIWFLVLPSQIEQTTAPIRRKPKKSSDKWRT